MTQNDRTLRVLLTAIVVLLSANLLVNLNSTSGPRAAYAAGIPDSGAQLQAVVDAAQDLNKKVEKLTSFLESGNLSVKVQEEKEKK